MSRVLPFGGSIDVSLSFRDVKTVDRSNINSKFSKRPPSRGTESTVFANEPESQPKIQKSPLQHRDPVAGVVGNEKQKNVGLRITHMDDVMKAREEYNYAHQRRCLKEATAPIDSTPANAVFTAYGHSYRGKAVVVHANQESMPRKERDEKKMERFRATPRTTSNVLIPHTLEDSTPKPKVQRFNASQRFNQSLAGVLGKPADGRPQTIHKVQAPWYTE